MKKLLILTLLVFVIAGCGEDEVGSPPPPPEPVAPFAGSPAQLMSNFQTAYEDQNIEAFKVMMHPDFEMILQQETIDQFPDVGETLDYTEEMRIAERMFSGEDLTDPNGQFIPGVQDITFGKLQPGLDWQLVPAGQPFAGSLFAPYTIEILFDRGQGHSYLNIQGQIRFHVAARDSLYEGEVQDYYEMVGQVDLTTIYKSSEKSSWGGVKAVYR